MLEKLIKNDRNEKLETVLEQKHIEEQVKNLLQGILYKIEVSYKDYQKAKALAGCRVGVHQIRTNVFDFVGRREPTC